MPSWSRLRTLIQGFGLRWQARGIHCMEDRYLDTHAFHFFRAGVACRLRHDNHRSELCLKALRPAVRGVADRMEVTEKLAHWPARAPVCFPGRRIKAMAVACGFPVAMRELVRLRQVRRTAVVRGADDFAVLISLDIAKVAGTSHVLREIEFELRGGSVARLRHLARGVGLACGLHTAPGSKFTQALAAAGVRVPAAGRGSGARLFFGAARQ